MGFLGAASIWKGTKTSGSNSVPEVHGLTTATSVWLSAAIGILAGGGLYVPGLFTTGIGVVYLRFAPRLSHPGDEEEAEHQEEDEEAPNSELRRPLNPQLAIGVGSSSPLEPSIARDRSSSGPDKVRREAVKATIHA